MKLETKKGVLSMDKRLSTIDGFGPGYIDKKLESIVGLQTEEPLKRAYMPIGGVRMAQQAAQAYGFETDKNIDDIFSKYRKTHNQGVFDAYTKEMKIARHTHIITGLPDSYARGRIIGDYRRVALYGIDYLVSKKLYVLENKYSFSVMNEQNITLREEITEQIKALKLMKNMALKYGFDISKPAKNAKEAIQ
jgi:formate C-acetyltransferase